MQIQLIRIELRVPEYGWTTQKVFHLMNFIVNGGDLWKSCLNLVYKFFISVLILIFFELFFCSTCNCVWISQAGFYFASKGK